MKIFYKVMLQGRVQILEIRLETRILPVLKDLDAKIHTRALAHMNYLGPGRTLRQAAEPKNAEAIAGPGHPKVE